MIQKNRLKFQAIHLGYKALLLSGDDGESLHGQLLLCRV